MDNTQNIHITLGYREKLGMICKLFGKQMVGRIKQGLFVLLLTLRPIIITKGQLFCPTLLFLQISLNKHAINKPLVVLVWSITRDTQSVWF